MSEAQNKEGNKTWLVVLGILVLVLTASNILTYFSLQNLQQKYNDLSYAYSNLKSDYSTLSQNYQNLQLQYSTLLTNYQNLQAEYSKLLSSMKFEKLEITSVYAISKDTTGWIVHIAVSNTGSADVIITMVVMNGVPNSNWGTAATILSPFPTSIPVGSSTELTVMLSEGEKIGSTTLTSGITLSIVLHSAAGKDYPSSVTLP
ncbi:MAG: hypothetical protein ACP5KW_11685 [Thermoproteota archaeon]